MFTEKLCKIKGSGIYCAELVDWYQWHILGHEDLSQLQKSLLSVENKYLLIRVVSDTSFEEVGQLSW